MTPLCQNIGPPRHNGFSVSSFLPSFTSLSLLNYILYPLMAIEITLHFWSLCSVNLKDKMSERRDWLLTRGWTLLPWFQTPSNLVPLTSVTLFPHCTLPTDSPPLSYSLTPVSLRLISTLTFPFLLLNSLPKCAPVSHCFKNEKGGT